MVVVALTEKETMVVVVAVPVVPVVIALVQVLQAVALVAKGFSPGLLEVFSL